MHGVSDTIQKPNTKNRNKLRSNNTNATHRKRRTQRRKHLQIHNNTTGGTMNQIKYMEFNEQGQLTFIVGTCKARDLKKQ
jgi:hypothetical protein